MNIVVTGAEGFIGKNLVAELQNRGLANIYNITRSTPSKELQKYCESADIVFHLAGVNRAKHEADFLEGNTNFTRYLLETLESCDNKCPVVMTSSIHAIRSNPYGVSKKAAEDILLHHGTNTLSRVVIFRLPNVFGKWSKPNYNSVVATFCHNIANNLPIRIDNKDTELILAHIDDVVEELINTIFDQEKAGFCEISSVYKITLGELADIIFGFYNSRKNLILPNVGDSFTKKLYSTYLSFLPTDQFAYSLKMNEDERGSFTEVIKALNYGQVSVNISKPGVIKGNHWHHSKTEKFLVVSGKGVIRFRKVDCDDIFDYFVDENNLEVIDIPPGYTHSIENLGETNLVTIIWANEVFDKNEPDTFYLEV